MKRKLQLHRETVRSLEAQDLGQAQGGNLSGALACWPSFYRTGCCVTPGCPTQAGTSC
jgi:hypothetical protein